MMFYDHMERVGEGVEDLRLRSRTQLVNLDALCIYGRPMGANRQKLNATAVLSSWLLITTILCCVPTHGVHCTYTVLGCDKTGLMSKYLLHVAGPAETCSTAGLHPQLDRAPPSRSRRGRLVPLFMSAGRSPSYVATSSLEPLDLHKLRHAT